MRRGIRNKDVASLVRNYGDNATVILVSSLPKARTYKRASWTREMAGLNRTDEEYGRCQLSRKDRRLARETGLVRRWRPMTPRCLTLAQPQLRSRIHTRWIYTRTPPTDSHRRWTRPTISRMPPICGSNANRISRNIMKSSPEGRSMPRLAHATSRVAASV